MLQYWDFLSWREEILPHFPGSHSPLELPEDLEDEFTHLEAVDSDLPTGYYYIPCLDKVIKVHH